MHPNPLFRSDDHEWLGALIDRVGFGMVFLTTPDGPRVAHMPLLRVGEDRLRFHLARSNALARHLDSATALVVVNGPDGYVSPRWYDDRATVPTWDYVALELEGLVRQLAYDELEDLLYRSIEENENRLGGETWTAAETPRSIWDKLAAAITGFELTIEHWRPTLKLSQKKSEPERERIAVQLAANGNEPLAAMMREVRK
jgi:transcriptional regulator